MEKTPRSPAGSSTRSQLARPPRGTGVGCFACAGPEQPLSRQFRIAGYGEAVRRQVAAQLEEEQLRPLRDFERVWTTSISRRHHAEVHDARRLVRRDKAAQGKSRSEEVAFKVSGAPKRTDLGVYDSFD